MLYYIIKQRHLSGLLLSFIERLPCLVIDLEFRSGYNQSVGSNVL